MIYKCPWCSQEFEDEDEWYPDLEKCPHCNRVIEWECGFAGDEDDWYCIAIKPYNVKEAIKEK